MSSKYLLFFIFPLMTIGCKHEGKPTTDDIKTTVASTSIASPKAVSEVIRVDTVANIIAVDSLQSANTAGDKPVNKVASVAIKPAKKTPKKKDAIVKTKAPKKRYAEINFDSYEHDFGEITEGDVVKHKFQFRNTSKHPLDIVSATATCGCTRPTFPFITIQPQEVHEIKVSFHSVGKSGPQSPEIIVTANTNPPKTILKLSGTVLPKVESDNISTDNTKQSPSDSTATDTVAVNKVPEPSKKAKPRKVPKSASTKISITKDSLR